MLGSILGSPHLGKLPSRNLPIAEVIFFGAKTRQPGHFGLEPLFSLESLTFTPLLTGGQ